MQESLKIQTLHPQIPKIQIKQPPFAQIHQNQSIKHQNSILALLPNQKKPLKKKKDFLFINCMK